MGQVQARWLHPRARRARAHLRERRPDPRRGAVRKIRASNKTKPRSTARFFQTPPSGGAALRRTCGDCRVLGGPVCTCARESVARPPDPPGGLSDPRVGAAGNLPQGLPPGLSPEGVARRTGCRSGFSHRPGCARPLTFDARRASLGADLRLLVPDLQGKVEPGDDEPLRGDDEPLIAQE